MSEDYNFISNYYRSFSGTDTLVFIILPNSVPVVLGSITTVSYSAYRTKQPVINLGRTNINGVTRGTRIYAGTMVFTLINQHWLNDLCVNDNLKWLADYNDLKADELPLFDLMIVSANEYGSYVTMFINGVDVTDEGQVISVEDLFTENTLKFVARDIETFKAGAITDAKVIYVSDKKKINQVRLSGFYIEDTNEFEDRLQKYKDDKYINDLENTYLFKQQEQKKNLDKMNNRINRELQYDPINLMVGNDVGYIQQRLRLWNFIDWLNYIYDKETEEAIRKFQSAQGLKITGVVDNKTYLALSKNPNGNNNPTGIIINESGARVYAYSNVYSSIVDVLPYNTIVSLIDKIPETTFTDPTTGEKLYESGNNFYQISQGYVNVNDVYSHEYSNNDIAFPVINYGESGPYITLLQEMLLKIYPNININFGIYDKYTEKYITQLQAENNIACILGVVNEETWRVLQTLTGQLATNITNNNVTISSLNPQGSYDLTSYDINTELFKGFDITVNSNKTSIIKCCAVAYYSNKNTKVITKQFSVKNNEEFTIPFSIFQSLFIYSIENEGFPTSVEYIVYPYNGQSYKWIINYRGE